MAGGETGAGIALGPGSASFRRRAEVYPLGTFGVVFANTLFAQWIVYFHAPPGVSVEAARAPGGAGFVGGVLLAGFVIQAALNPFVGLWADAGTRALGRRRPFLLFGTPLLVLAFLGMWVRAGRAVAASCIAAYCGLFVVVVQPYMTLLPEVASDARTRARFALEGAVLGLIGAGAALVGGPLLIERGSFLGLGASGAFVFALAILGTGIVVRERPPGPRAPGPSSARALVVSIGEAARRPVVGRFLIANGLLLLAVMVLTMLGPYLVEVLMGRPRRFTAVMNAWLFGGMLASLPFLAWGARRLDALRLLRIGAGAGAAATALVMGVALAFEGGGPLPVWLGAMVGVGLAVITGMAAPPLVVSRLAELDGRSREGLYFGLNGMALNLGNAVAALVVGVLLSRGSTPERPQGVLLCLGAAAVAFALAAVIMPGGTETMASRPAPDDALQAEIAGVRARPVFIMGLHRSGTTFLYQALADLLPVAYVSVYHVLCYDRILAGAKEGTAQADRAAIDARFAAAGRSTRAFDEVPLGHATPEEYGFILARKRGALRCDARTSPLVVDLCRKLVATSAGSGTVLLKNPWDTGHGPEILSLLPDARFIYLRRDPARVLSSQLKNAYHFGSGPDLLLDLLLEEVRLARLVIGAQRLLYRLVGRERYGRVMVRLLMRDVLRESVAYRRALAALPSDRAIEVEYEALCERPAEVLGRIAGFLGLEPRGSLEEVRPRPRRGALLPLVERHEAGFRARLERALARVG